MKRRRNPFDPTVLVKAGVPLACAVALYELAERGARVELISGIAVADTSSARGADVAELSRMARETCERAVVVDFDASDARALQTEITRAAARTFYVMWWLTEREMDGHVFRGDPFRAAPKTPRRATQFAEKYVREFEKKNRIPLGIAYMIAANMPGRHTEEPTAERFGHYLAMQAMGHSVAWDDDHPSHGFVVPSDEYYG